MSELLYWIGRARHCQQHIFYVSTSCFTKQTFQHVVIILSNLDQFAKFCTNNKSNDVMLSKISKMLLQKAYLGNCKLKHSYIAHKIRTTAPSIPDWQSKLHWVHNKYLFMMQRPKQTVFRPAFMLFIRPMELRLTKNVKKQMALDLKTKDCEPVCEPYCTIEQKQWQGEQLFSHHFFIFVSNKYKKTCFIVFTVSLCRCIFCKLLSVFHKQQNSGVVEIVRPHTHFIGS